MATIRFYLKPLSNGEAQVMASFQNGSGVPPTKYTGYNIPGNKIQKDGKAEYKYWDKKNQRVRGVPKAIEINKKITDWSTRFDTYISACNINEEAPDIEAFKLSLVGSVTTGAFVQRKPKNVRKTLVQVANEFLEYIKPTHEPRTYDGYKVTVGQIEDYEKHEGVTLYLDDINKDFYRSYGLYLISEEDNSNNTINRKQGRIITFMNFAFDEKKYIKTKEYTTRYKFKKGEAPKFPLKPEEIAVLRGLKLTDTYHQLILDAFLFACETGLRYSDVVQLQGVHIQSQVVKDSIINYLDLTNIKTDNRNNIPLSKYAMDIANKYFNEGRLFNFHYSQSASRVLKTVFTNAGLNRPCEIIRMQGAKTIRETVPLHDIISFHMGRNTYITRLLLSNLAPVHVKDNAGHGDIKVTMGYFRPDDITRWQETLRILNQ